MIKIGITGGVGSGKSEVLRYLKERYGAVVLLADEAAALLERKGQPCYNLLVKAFSGEILGNDGEIDRKKFADIIFRDRDNLKKVNDIVHPAVRKYILDVIKSEEEKGTKLFILEAALLIEEGYDKILDELWYVYTGESIRYERLKRDRGYSDEKIKSIMSRQLDEAVFRDKCRRVIENNGDIEALHHNIKLCVEEVIKSI